MHIIEDTYADAIRKRRFPANRKKHIDALAILIAWPNTKDASVKCYCLFNVCSSGADNCAAPDEFMNCAMNDSVFLYFVVCNLKNFDICIQIILSG